VLTIVVFFHELAISWWPAGAGVKVADFLAWLRGRNSSASTTGTATRWKISAVPLGGYVKFFGDDSEASTPSSETLSSMTEEERSGQFPSQEKLDAGGDRGRRSNPPISFWPS